MSAPSNLAGTTTEPLALVEMVASSSEASMESSGSARPHPDCSREELEAAKDQWLAMVGHELRTPLAVIVGNAELLAEDESINDDAHLVAQVSAVVRSANRLVRLVDDVLTLSALESSTGPVKRELVEMRQVVERANREVTTDGRTPSPALNLPDYPVEVRGDSAQLHRAVRCLIDNAVKFTADKGRVDVELRHVHGHAQLDVVDSGCGIALNDLAMIFTRFHRSAPSDRSALPGAGLGLAIVDQIVRHHGGRVTVTSREGQGSTFRVVLPTVDRRGTGPRG